MLPLKVISETCQNRKYALKIKYTVDIKDDIDCKTKVIYYYGNQTQFLMLI